MKIGLIGLGRMGRAIQARLAAQGLDVVGWDRDAAAMQRAAGNGMTIAAHPRAVADAADGTVISIITEDNGVAAYSAARMDFCPATCAASCSSR